MSRMTKTLLLLTLLVISIIPFANTVQAGEPIIYAVLFYSTTCPHCEQVINEVLPPLVEKYGLQLQIFALNTYEEKGNELYQATVEEFEIPNDRLGVPTLIVGDYVLVGSGEIPAQLPGIIEEGLAQGGIDWPSIPGLEEARNAPTESATPETQSTVKGKFQQDIAGNSLSVVVLLGMIASLVILGMNFDKRPTSNLASQYQWLIPVLAVIGLGIAGYMSFVEATQTEAVCGPVGHCNEVQQSSYATLFGFLPVGFLGLGGGVIILLTWILQNYGPEKWRQLTSTALWGLTLFGTLFSIYLTFLEPFVIGASCLWCLSSAVIMTLLLWLSTNNAKHVWSKENLQEA
ncbi:MAG: vitamin K epoxide reductase family protein [Chloroflexota bacterium]|nr:vitamin K epoxide reductase family protein [Chloroflexota bacterium]